MWLPSVGDTAKEAQSQACAQDASVPPCGSQLPPGRSRTTTDTCGPGQAAWLTGAPCCFFGEWHADWCPAWRWPGTMSPGLCPSPQRRPHTHTVALLGSRCGGHRNIHRGFNTAGREPPLDLVSSLAKQGPPVWKRGPKDLSIGWKKERGPWCFNPLSGVCEAHRGESPGAPPSEADSTRSPSSREAH
ncbi:uncharacterized protein LOC132004870 isoform X1 [Mustela nigripes]|uniref:uncharacterized protein LOC132004870 isoform X1 n=1 Tax=Mustela nigripes TaxID=77151 RepID=UPI002815881E|nr:uncharacterized protein LOC132004870 isoform X1 [Mustela nigripes]